MAWNGNCSAQDRKKLRKVVCTAQTIREANLPSMDSIYTAHCHGKAANIIKGPHPNLVMLSSARQKIQKLEHTHQQVQEQLLPY
eukprot:g20804.t1